MKTTFFTPGPWRARNLYYSDHPDNARVEIVAAPKHENHTATKVAEAAYSTVADEYHVSDRAEAEANARLIAAAPDLLEVCEQLAESAEYWSEYDVPLGIVEKLRAAIAKAKGETP